MTKFVVDRRTWYRGKGERWSRLLTPKGMRCCIGFVGAQCGIPDSDLLRKKAIFGYLGILVNGEWPAWIIGCGTGSADLGYAYEINDNPSIDDATRERRLKEIFANNGDEIVFEN